MSKLCRCGCGEDISHQDKRSHLSLKHSRADRVKIRYQLARDVAVIGMVPADEWRQCEVCRQWFPIFYKIHGRTRVIKTCPDFISDTCSKLYRVAQKPTTYKKTSTEDRATEKSFRSTVCDQNGLCANYSECSDREFNDTPKARRWEYEVYGKDCFKRVWISELASSSFGSVHSHPAGILQ